MLNLGKCPHCKLIVMSVRIEDVDIQVEYNSEWKGISYLCPHCSTILSVQIDPVALKTDTVKEVLKGGATG